MENFSNEPLFQLYMLFYVEKYILSILFYSSLISVIKYLSKYNFTINNFTNCFKIYTQQ